MSAEKKKLYGGTSTPTRVTYPGRHPVNDGAKTWIIFLIVLLLVAVAVIALRAGSISPQSISPKPTAHPVQRY